MSKNMGMLDRALRLVIALVIAWLWYSGAIGGWLAIVLGIFAVAFLATSLVGWCPLYGPFGWSTKKPAPGHSS